MRSVRGSSRAWSVVKNKKRRAPRKKMPCYEKRNDKLLELGYTSYVAYLASDDWKKIRNRKLARYPHCLLCGVPASQVHHLRYDYSTLLGFHDLFLVQLCSGCHKKIEFNGEKKRHLKDANRVLFELASACVRGQRWIIRMETHPDRRRKRRK